MEGMKMEMCQFKTFWQQVHSQGELIKSVQVFEDSVRRFVCHVICITYQTTEEVVLGELLGLVQETSVAYWLEQYGWKATGAGLVTAKTSNYSCFYRILVRWNINSCNYNCFYRILPGR